MRSCGQSYAGVSTLCSLMNMPKPMTANNYDKLAKRFAEVTQQVAEETMMDAANEIRENNPETDSSDDGIVDTAISHDGTWQLILPNMTCGKSIMSVVLTIVVPLAVWKLKEQNVSFNAQKKNAN